MSDLSNYLENEILDHILGTTSFTMPSVFMSLHSGHPAETGANELAGGSYVRQAVAFDAAAAGTADNTSDEEFDLTGVSNGTVFFIGLWDASTVGNFLWAAPLIGTAATFSGANAGDVLTSFAHGYANDDRVYVKRGGGSALPAGLAEDTLYHVVGVTTDTFQLSATQGGAAVTITADGEGIAVRATGKAFNNGDLFRIPAGDADFSLD